MVGTHKALDDTTSSNSIIQMIPHHPVNSKRGSNMAKSRILHGRSLSIHAKTMEDHPASVSSPDSPLPLRSPSRIYTSI